MQSEIGEDILEHVSSGNDFSENGTGKEPKKKDSEPSINLKDLVGLKSQKKFIEKLGKKGISVKKISKIIRYENELEKLQIELVKLQRWVQDQNRRVAILFEGRDAAGKGGSIRRFIEHLNPRALRVVALPKPTEEEMGQWYFQRYIKHMPTKGEIVLFDRSWYNLSLIHI